jgi:hypothetical protein
MNHKLIRMMEEAGFSFTPDTMYRMPEFENLVRLEREECAKAMDSLAEKDLYTNYFKIAANAIRAMEHAYKFADATMKARGIKNEIT